MESWAAILLISFSNFIGVVTTPESSDIWKTRGEWVKNARGASFEAQSNLIIDQCKTEPEKSIIFPTVVHGVHSILLDGQLIAESGDPSFRQASPFYSTIHIPCNLVLSGNNLTWKVESYSHYFARFSEYPFVRAAKLRSDVFPLTVNIFAFGAMFIFGLFVLIVFNRKIPLADTFSIGAGSLLFSVYFLMVANSAFGIQFSMLTAHKLADVGLWLGALLMLYGFKSQNFLSRAPFYFFVASSTVGLSFVIFGRNGDEVQLGTMIPLLSAVACAFDNTRVLAISKGALTKVRFLNALAVIIFFITAVNDTLAITGVIATPMLLAIGMPGTLFTFGLALNEKISETYRERDTLLQTLETRVEEKTKSLSEAMQDLKRSQAELVQSARLASLGTLSAGIAHEINNAINFVSGAIVPLERQLKKAEMDEVARARISRLLGSMKEGTQLTVGIVKSLRSYTGLNQADVKAADIGELIDSVLLITKSRLRDIQISKNIEPGLMATVHIVGLNQILMNLITNAADAVDKDQGKIEISAYQEAVELVLEINDNGCGMSPEVQQRIFEPFYTTKEVGKGTGLGMHIVHKEIERHKGRLEIDSIPGQGTTMKIYIPNAQEVRAKEAA